MTDELWDLYDADRGLLGCTMRRGDAVPPGCYHLVVRAWIKNRAGQLLISKRHPDKHFGLLWEMPSGAAVAGEDSLTAALREAREEVGIRLNPRAGRLLHTQRRDRYATFVDTWLFEAEADTAALALQPEEVVAVCWATLDDIRALDAAGQWVPVIDYRTDAEMIYGGR